MMCNMPGVRKWFPSEHDPLWPLLSDCVPSLNVPRLHSLTLHTDTLRLRQMLLRLRYSLSLSHLTPIPVPNARSDCQFLPHHWKLGISSTQTPYLLQTD